MYRARSRAGLSLREAAEKVSRLKLVSSNTLSRLEHMSFPPRSRNQRQAAYIASLAYKIDPSEFGLSENDRPPWATDTVIEELRTSTNWLIGEDITAGQTALYLVDPARLPGI
jgi:transcriptional regulator with XRE-family HTH domain